MPRKPNPPPDDAKQAKRFIETAKQLEADKSGEAFNKALDIVVAKQSTLPKKPSDTK